MADMDRINKSPRLRKLIAGLRELVSYWRNGGNTATIPQVGDEFATGLAVWVLTEHAVALTESLILLAEKGMFIQTAPLIRLTMECGVTAAWLTVTPNAEKSASHEEVRQRRAFVENVIRMGSGGMEEVLTQVDFEMKELSEHETEDGRKFEARCKSILGGENLYLRYRSLSAISHGQLSLMRHYLYEDITATDPLLRYSLLSPSKFPQADQEFETQVISLVLALTAWDNLEDGHPRRERIEHAASQFGIRADIKWSGQTV